MGYQGGGQLGSADCNVAVATQSPMELAIRRVEEQFKMLADELDKLQGKLQGVSSSKPCSPSDVLSKQPTAFAPIVEITNAHADKIANVRDRVKTMRESLDI